MLFCPYINRRYRCKVITFVIFASYYNTVCIADVARVLKWKYKQTLIKVAAFGAHIWCNKHKKVSVTITNT